MIFFIFKFFESNLIQNFLKKLIFPRDYIIFNELDSILKIEKSTLWERITGEVH